MVNIVLGDLDLHFQCQTFSCYAFDIKKIGQAADVIGRFAMTRTAPNMKLLLYVELRLFGLATFLAIVYPEAWSNRGMNSTNERTNGRTDGRTDGRTEGRTHGRTTDE